jgi:hypothetical protein
MGKLLAGSILIVPILIARYAAGLKNPRRGFYRAMILALAFNTFYAFALIYLYFRLS